MVSADGGDIRHTELQSVTVGEDFSVRQSLANRIWVVAAVSVVVAVMFGGLISYPLVQSAAVNQMREELSRQADLAQELVIANLSGEPVRGRVGPEFAAGVIVIPVVPGRPIPEPLRESDIVTIERNASFSLVRETPEARYFLEGRPIGLGQGIVLVQRDDAADAPAAVLMTRLVIALIIGLIAAAIIAYFVAKRTAKPLYLASLAARRLAQGERNVGVEVEGAAEVADIAEALNLLAHNLALSENRQREFFMAVSHELRTPLTSIKGYAEAMADGIIDSDEIEKTGVLVTNETARLERLVSDLLDIARLDAVDFQLHLTDTSLNNLLDDVVQAWTLICQKEHIQFSSTTTVQDVALETDPIRLRQCVDNLLENALRVTQSGGDIRLDLVVNAHGAEIHVQDSGPGLSDDDLHVAFESGALHSRYRGIRQVGTGLGLALVYKLVYRLGGTIKVQHSTLGGAHFVIRMPLSHP